jgi:hypothetical protein
MSCAPHLTVVLWLAGALLFASDRGTAAAEARSGMPVEGSANLRLLGWTSVDGRPGVMLSEAAGGRQMHLFLVPGERSGSLECQRLDVVNGICVLLEGQALRTLRLPMPLDSGLGEACLWLTNFPAGQLTVPLGQVGARTLLMPESLKDTVMPSLICGTMFKTNAVKEMTRVYNQRGIALVPHGDKCMLALPKKDEERYLKALPPLPGPAVPGRVIRVGSIRFVSTPLAQVAGIYGDLTGRKPARLSGQGKAISLSLMTDLTIPEVKHLMEVVFLINDLKVVPVVDTGFDIVEW